MDWLGGSEGGRVARERTGGGVAPTALGNGGLCVPSPYGLG
jgi:hypothetical protein